MEVMRVEEVKKVNFYNTLYCPICV